MARKNKNNKTKKNNVNGVQTPQNDDVSLGLEKELTEIMGMDVQNLGSADKGKKKGSRKKLWIGGAVVILVLAGVGVGAYIVKAQEYKDTFFPGTVINGIDCSNLTVDQAEKQIKEQVEDYQITLLFRNEESVTLNGKDFDYSYVNGTAVSELLQNQNILEWYPKSQETEEFSVESNTTFDEEELKALLEEQPQLQKENQVSPVNAKIVYKKNKFRIADSKAGTKIDEDELITEVSDAIKSGSSELDLQDTAVYVAPKVLEDDKKLAKQVKQLNSLARCNITIQLPGGDRVLNGRVVRRWLVKDADGNYTRDDDQLLAQLTTWVANMAADTDTMGSTMNFKATDGNTVAVRTVDYGWQIDQTAEIAALKELIYNNETVTREPVYISKMSTTENGGFGNTYIEANLTDQYVYFYKDGNLVWESDCVSGKMSEDRATPSGIYLLDYKQKDRTLRGPQLEDGSYSYESHVDYWMPFYGGYGFHDASWRDEFGGSIYVYSGSHGCINLPTYKAASLYDLIDTDIPIIVFYETSSSLVTDTDGTEDTTESTDTEEYTSGETEDTGTEE